MLSLNEKLFLLLLLITNLAVVIFLGNMLSVTPFLQLIREANLGGNPADYLNVPCNIYRDLQPEDIVEIKRGVPQIVLGIAGEAKPTDILRYVIKEILKTMTPATPFATIAALSERLILTDTARLHERLPYDRKDWEILKEKLQGLTDLFTGVTEALKRVAQVIQNNEVMKACEAAHTSLINAWSSETGRPEVRRIIHGPQPWQDITKIVDKGCDFGKMTTALDSIVRSIAHMHPVG